jgi:hypothetical protein
MKGATNVAADKPLIKQIKPDAKIQLNYEPKRF